MTKEKLLELTSQLNRYDVDDFNHFLTEFFDSNVCIPKGVNRHPCADILHQWIEGAEVEFSLKGQWISFSNINDVYTEGEGVRIKPPEPVWEYQYVIYDKDKEIARSIFLTEHEYDISCLSFEWLMDVKSKRVRE